jgi:NTE family protein
MREMRAISFVTSLIDEDANLASKLKKMLVHSISADDVMTGLGVASKLNADWDFLISLRDAGRTYASAWLEENFALLGKESTVDIASTFL